MRIEEPRTPPGPEAVATLGALLASPRPVLIAGPTSEPERVGPAVTSLAIETGAVLLADPLSGARFGPGSEACVAGYDLFLADAEVRAALSPTAIVRVGASPTSAALQRWIVGQDGVPYIVIDGESRWKDHGETATEYLRADPTATLRAVVEHADPGAGADDSSRGVDATWRERWRSAEAAALEAVSAAPLDSNEGEIFARVAATVPPDTALFVSSSMPVRDLDAYGRPRPEPLLAYANRGASGIDGVVSSAFGVAAAHDGPTVCAIGDLALFHDQNGLLWSREPDCAVVFVLVDNDGGGIFHQLPIAEHEPHFTPLFATPHGLDLTHAARMHDLSHDDVLIDDLERALTAAVQAGRSCILRVTTDRTEATARRAEVRAETGRRAREALAEPTGPDAPAHRPPAETTPTG